MREATVSIKCWTCGASFLARRSDAKTCSQECKRLENNRKARKYERQHWSTCLRCGTRTSRRSNSCVSCGQQDRINKISGEHNYNWKGGIHRDNKGYVHLLVPPENRKGHRYRPEHHVVWEAANGPVPEKHIIHHKNGIKDDNRLDNLEALPRKQHNHRHGVKRIKELEEENRRLREQLNGMV